MRVAYSKPARATNILVKQKRGFGGIAKDPAPVSLRLGGERVFVEEKSFTPDLKISGLLLASIQERHPQ
jgi:hypothetical protein